MISSELGEKVKKNGKKSEIKIEKQFFFYSFFVRHTFLKMQQSRIYGIVVGKQGAVTYNTSFGHGCH